MQDYEIKRKEYGALSGPGLTKVAHIKLSASRPKAPTGGHPLASRENMLSTIPEAV
jgi:hypothetical protein